jgi:peptidoglycan/xylan/chitin deacetylase (PgdA/CDA1 family)
MSRRQTQPIATRQNRRKAIRLFGLTLFKMLGGFALIRASYRRRIRILCYHGAWAVPDGFPGDSMFIRPETFRSRLEHIRNLGFNVISLDQAVNIVKNDDGLPSEPVVITIDDGWSSTFAHMLPALKEFGMPATIYCDTGNLLAAQLVPHVMANYLRDTYPVPPGSEETAQAAYLLAVSADSDRNSKIASVKEFARLLGVDWSRYEVERVFSYMTPLELAQADQDGFAIELHTHTHDLHNFDPPKVVDEIKSNRNALAKMLNRDAQSFRHFCYPSGRASPLAAATLRSLGILSATTLESRFATRADDPLLLPRLIDGDHLTPIEFEAAICGVGEFVRSLKRVVARGLHFRMPMLARTRSNAVH